MVQPYHARKASSSSTTLESQDVGSQVFTIGKVDAGIAVLISDSVHLIEFPSLLLPAGVGPGSIVNISCTRNLPAERATSEAFWDLQSSILSEYGSAEPVAPKLRVRNTTQTSVTLEWDKLELAASKLLSLSIWRNGQRLTTIPNPTSNTSTKLSGLALDTDYTFHLVLKTSGGTYQSPTVKVHTHTIADTSGVAVCFGHVEPQTLLDEAKEALVKMKGKATDKISIETTHYVATSPATPGSPQAGPGVEYQKALQLSIPVVSPEWVIACAREAKMVPIANYYSIGTTNHAASLSSATLVTPTGAIPASKQPLPRRATAVAIEEANEDGEPDVVVPAVAPPPSDKPVLAEEEPDAPPNDEEQLPASADTTAQEETTMADQDGDVSVTVPVAEEPPSEQVVQESQAGLKEEAVLVQALAKDAEEGGDIADAEDGEIEDDDGDDPILTHAEMEEDVIQLGNVEKEESKGEGKKDLIGGESMEDVRL